MAQQQQPNTGSGMAVDLEITPGSWGVYVNEDRPVLTANIERIGVIRSGMKSGAPSLAILARGDNGETIHVQASWRAFGLAAVALIAKWGTP
jgi:hypothetical protein